MMDEMFFHPDEVRKVLMEIIVSWGIEIKALKKKKKKM
jgi:hypothetical protein